MTAHYDAGPVAGEIIGGVRLHYEQGDNVDIAGSSPTARTGAIQGQQTRSVLALAAYVRPTFEFFDHHLEIAPGVRVESMFSSIRVDRQITQAGGVVDGAYQAPVVTTYDSPQTAQPSTVAFIPGISGTVKVDDALALYGGVHRGFVPPGVRDALTGGARNLALQAEWAWNFEWGARGQPARWLRYEAAAFYIDYETQVLPPSAATVTADGGALPSGSSTSYGIEASTRFDFATAASLGFELPLTVAYTYAEARFGAGWAPGIAGNVVPYVPAHTLSGRHRLRAPDRHRGAGLGELHQRAVRRRLQPRRGDPRRHRGPHRCPRHRQRAGGLRVRALARHVLRRGAEPLRRALRVQPRPGRDPTRHDAPGVRRRPPRVLRER